MLPEVRAKLRPHQIWLALALILVVLGLGWRVTRREPLNVYDQPFYLGIAFDLVHSGTFTDGFVFETATPGQPRGPGMRFAPLYPALLATASQIDAPLRAGLDCVVATRAKSTSCPDGAASVRGAQFAMVCGFYLLIWIIARMILGSPKDAWLALVISFATVPILLRYAGFLMTETTSIVLFTGATALLVRATASKRPLLFLSASGAVFGLAALTRPAMLDAVLGLGLPTLVAVLVRPATRQAWRYPAILLLAFTAVIGPWLLRNALVVGHFGLTHGYDSHTLVQRVSFDSMTWPQYGLSYLCWLPDGAGLGDHLFGPHACDPFGWDERPDTFYSIGNTTLMRDTLAAAGGWDGHLAFLLRHFVFAHPIKHGMVTLSLALRGAWIEHYWGLVLMPICAVTTIAAVRRRDLGFLAAAGPAWFMLMFNAAVAVNQVRYNLVLIPAFAIAGAAAVSWSIDLWRRRARRNTCQRAS